jgi:hypothetical protein
VHVDGVRVTRQVDDGPLLSSVSANQRRHLHSKRSSRKENNAAAIVLVGLSRSCRAPSVSHDINWTASSWLHVVHHHPDVVVLKRDDDATLLPQACHSDDAATLLPQACHSNDAATLLTLQPRDVYRCVACSPSCIWHCNVWLRLPKTATK